VVCRCVPGAWRSASGASGSAARFEALSPEFETNARAQNGQNSKRPPNRMPRRKTRAIHCGGSVLGDDTDMEGRLARQPAQPRHPTGVVLRRAIWGKHRPLAGRFRQPAETRTPTAPKDQTASGFCNHWIADRSYSMDQSADSRRRLPIFRRLTAAATVDRLPSSVLRLQSSEPDAPCSMLHARCPMLHAPDRGLDAFGSKE
jgi:hypothetical protein